MGDRLDIAPVRCNGPICARLDRIITLYPTATVECPTIAIESPHRHVTMTRTNLHTVVYVLDNNVDFSFSGSSVPM